MPLLLAPSPGSTRIGSAWNTSTSPAGRLRLTALRLRARIACARPPVFEGKNELVKVSVHVLASDSPGSVPRSQRFNSASTW